MAGKSTVARFVILALLSVFLFTVPPAPLPPQEAQGRGRKLYVGRTPEVWQEEDQWVARISFRGGPDLVSQGRTPQLAAQRVADAATLYIENHLGKSLSPENLQTFLQRQHRVVHLVDKQEPGKLTCRTTGSVSIAI